MGPTLETVRAAKRRTAIDGRVLFLSLLAVAIGLAAGVVAQALLMLIGFITNLSFYGRSSLGFVSPANNHLGLFVILVPVAGGLIVGLMARYGSVAIRGHGIPEVMETVLRNQSRVPPRLILLKPVSAAIAIGTGGPFGAEGPIIATGAALGSFIGQLLKTTAEERKTLLAAGAAAGMAATFGSPVSSILLAVELLLFEFRSRSLIPVTFASAVAAAVRVVFMGTAPIFAMPAFGQPGGSDLALYALIGVLVGVASVIVTRAVYLTEDGFAELPIHWMWWPALGGLAVGIVGYFAPHTLGVGYDNISRILSGAPAERVIIILGALKCISWVISLASGTSGGTLAPLFTIGGALGAALAGGMNVAFPQLGLDVRVAGLVGMAAMFAGASRALFASIVFAFETTQQPAGILPLIVGCAAAYVVSSLLMSDTIMTEKITRRGITVPTDYSADFLSQVMVREVASYDPVSLRADSTLAQARSWIMGGGKGTEHRAFPVVDGDARLLGMVNRDDVLDSSQPAEKWVGDFARSVSAVAFEDDSLREANDLMAREGVGRLPIMSRDNPQKIVAILSSRDIRSANRRRLEETEGAEQSIRLRPLG